ncbi:MAG: extracellular solute-binding protein family 5 [Myxococcales bacterium]|nr:extracellular solute-binding protein family 5 [Myxococcales bacterium]
MLLAAPASAETRAQYGGAVQAAMASAPTTFDPLHGGAGDGELAALLYDTPFVSDAAGRVRPSLALALDNPDGALRARLTLRSDVRFSDGTPLGARDVAASITRALREPAGWTLAPIKSARAAGNETVELELLRPTPELALLLSTPAAAVTPAGAPPSKRPIGSGPFTVEGVDAGQVRLAANAGCFAGRPYLDTLTLRAFAARADEAGSYEVGALQAARHADTAMAASGPHRPAIAVEGAQTITGFVAVGRIPDADLVRRVLAIAINRDRLRRLTVREPASVVKGAYDPGRARSEVERRWPGTRPKLTLLVDASRFDDRDVAERILADLARAGIDVGIDAVDAAQYQARVESWRYELYLGAATPPAPDAALATLALVAAVDPAAARALLAGPAGNPVDVDATRVVPLYHRAARLFIAPELRDLTVDGAGRGGWADAHWLAR